MAKDAKAKANIKSAVPKTTKTEFINAKTSGTKTANASLTGPTYLTILRMMLAVAFLCFALMPEMWARIVALVLFVMAAITDKIDGIWARRCNIVTDLGAFLDPLADKMLVDLAFLALVHTNTIPLWVFAVVIVRDLAVDGMRMMAARTGKTIAASMLGKVKTTFQMTALIIILANRIFNLEVFMIIGNITLYIAVALTIYSGIDYIIKGYNNVIRK